MGNLPSSLLAARSLMIFCLFPGMTYNIVNELFLSQICPILQNQIFHKHPILPHCRLEIGAVKASNILLHTRGQSVVKSNFLLRAAIA